MSRKKLSSTVEDYLEIILNLEKNKKFVRVKDIAQEMGVKLPTVTSMLNNLVEQDLINHKKYESVELTKKGKRIARDVYHRHVILRDFLTTILGLDLKTAEEDACKMEHAISPSTLERLIKFMEFIEVCPRCGTDWPLKFNQYMKYGRDEDKCLQHMKAFEGSFSSEVKKLESKIE